MKWTPEQQNVIDFRNRNILVSAAAGSGKTAVLVERIIKRITDKDHPTDIDRLLVVTFTKAAAAEMKERIGAAIDKKLEEDPKNENLRAQQTLLHNAQITTIDSFCLFVVRNHFEEIHLDPNFRIADTGEIKLLEQDVLNQVIEEAFAQGEEQFLQLAEAYGSKKDNEELKDMIHKIYQQSASNPWPEEWILGLGDLYKVETVAELVETDLIQGLAQYVKALVPEYIRLMKEALALSLMPDGPSIYAETLQKELDRLEELAAANDYITLQQYFANSIFGSLPQCRDKSVDADKKKLVQDKRNKVKKEIEQLKGRSFAMPLEELLEQIGRIRPFAQELIRIALVYTKAMGEEKAKKHIMDFSDIEHAALRIFVDEKTKEIRPTAMDFRRQFDEIMIDEYQDSNQVQEEILSAISREDEGEYNRFMVGDVKQSIYRFRMARPELFMEKYGTYSLTESKCQRIDLHMNFRSRKEVLDFTNDVFYKIMGMDLGNVAYDEDAALYLGASFPDNPDMKPEILLYETDALDVEDEENEDSNLQLEARMVAAKIRELKQYLKVKDKATEELRPVQNKDIVILLRALRGVGQEFAAVLTDNGIPAHVTTSTGYFSAVEVQIVLDFLRILDNPYQDIPMAAVLASPIGGLTNEELAQLRIAKPDVSFAKAALEAMSQEPEGDVSVWQQKILAFGQLYHNLRRRVVDTPIHQLLEQILRESGYADYVRAMPSGELRSGNLSMLLEKAIAYESTSYKGLFHFVRYIEKLQKYQVDFGEAEMLGENDDVVRIMTIHGSMGLEFPVVFVSNISKKFSTQENKEKMSIHPDMGMGLDEMSSNPRTKRKSLVRGEILDRNRRDDLGEALRILYVALTRAKEKLILTGTCKNQEAVYGKYGGNIREKELLPFATRSNATSFESWLLPAVMSYPDKYEITFRNAEDLVLDEAKAQAEHTLDQMELSSQIQGASQELVEKLKEQLAYAYPYLEEKSKKSKYSVSELKHASMVASYDKEEGEAQTPDFLIEEEERYVPAFAREKVETEEGVSGALYGTAVHRVMECMNFAGLIDKKDDKEIRTYLQEEMNRMQEEGLLSRELASLLRSSSLMTFLTSSLAGRMAAAEVRGDLFREKPFVMDYEGA
ncbi:MAG: helicase-exonuclease AddAB subunit AddA, partial [Agathobacter sp.]|nr:helicase-exonuclease AddAB subunit AddA [Agathobacter sp.]